MGKSLCRFRLELCEGDHSAGDNSPPEGAGAAHAAPSSIRRSAGPGKLPSSQARSNSCKIAMTSTMQDSREHRPECFTIARVDAQKCGLSRGCVGKRMCLTVLAKPPKGAIVLNRGTAGTPMLGPRSVVGQSRQGKAGPRRWPFRRLRFARPRLTVASPPQPRLTAAGFFILSQSGERPER
jgi:hypothetical protein